MYVLSDILLFPTGDWHNGSTTALHPNVKKIKGKYIPLEQTDGWGYSNNPRYQLSSLQKRLWKHFEKCLDDIAKKRKGKKLYMIQMGDAIDGDHHGTHQIVTREIDEQIDTHVELMKYTKERLSFQRGDVLAYLQGTEVHVGRHENKIGEKMGAIEYESGVYAAPHLSLNLNGVLIWAYHKGVSAGQGMTRGNAMINKLKQIYYQCLQNGDVIPEMIFSAHTHDQHHATWTRPDGKTMHYLITAPFQDKTRFSFDNLATNKNKVGAQAVTITGDGGIIVHAPLLMASPLGFTLK